MHLRTAMVVWLRLDFLPLRYMHTTVEMVHRDDVVIKLIYETILKLENNETFSYFK
jgi:putative aminopeptidase FrvX